VLLAANVAATTPEMALTAVASAAEQAARTIVPEPVKEIGSQIATGVTEFVSGAANAVSDFIENVTEQRPATESATVKKSRAVKATDEKKKETKTSSRKKK